MNLNFYWISNWFMYLIHFCNFKNLCIFKVLR